MKLIVVLSIAEHQERAAALLHRAGIKRFSVAPIAGYRKNKDNASLNWFSPRSQDVKTRSIALFSFAPDESVARVIEEVNQCNHCTGGPFPLHAFVLDVLQHADCQ